MSYSAFTRPVWHWLRQPAVAPQHHFGIPYDLTPRYTGTDFVRSHRRFTAALPWPVRSRAMNAIDTHDTPRFLERADEQLQRVAAALSFALPGTPVLFAGDEFALRGALGEEARTPLPWQRTPVLASFYAELSATRQHSPSLRDGGLRWLHADADAIAFVRETRDSSAVVVAFRSEARLSLSSDVFGGRRQLEALLRSGNVGVTEGVGTFEFHADGPAVAIWSATPAENATSTRPGGLVGARV
jgi:alpha-glucosidase